MSKKRVSLTLEDRLVEKIDREAERRRMNRSQTVEEILEDYLRNRDIETAAILCGGKKAKSLSEYSGKPVLEHILDHLSSEGISRVILLAGRNKEIEEVFGSSHSGMALEYVLEDRPGGTAAALREVEDRIEQSFLLMNGHVISDVDLGEMLRTHREEGSIATMALTTVEDPSNYGVAKLKGRRILGFEEKPEKGEEPSRLINAGAYILEPEIFFRLDRPSIEEVFEELAEERELTGYIYGGEWKDIDED